MNLLGVSTFVMCSELGSMRMLVRLNLNSNKLSGTIPPGMSVKEVTEIPRKTVYILISLGLFVACSELGNLALLSMLSLRLNELTGTVPVGMTCVL